MIKNDKHDYERIVKFYLIVILLEKMINIILKLFN